MIRNANKEISDLHEQAARRRWQLQRLDTIIHAIDDLLYQLEDLNIQGVDRVPAPLRENVNVVLQTVPGREEHEHLRVRYRVVPMMDVLFRAQELLFRAKHPEFVFEEDEATP